MSDRVAPSFSCGSRWWSVLVIDGSLRAVRGDQREATRDLQVSPLERACDFAWDRHGESVLRGLWLCVVMLVSV